MRKIQGEVASALGSLFAALEVVWSLISFHPSVSLFCLSYSPNSHISNINEDLSFLCKALGEKPRKQG